MSRHIRVEQDDMTAVPEVSPSVKCVQADPRVSPDHSQSCSGYSQNSHLTYGFLFPPGKAADVCQRKQGTY